MVEQPLQVAGNLFNELIGHWFSQYILLLSFGPQPKRGGLGMYGSQQFLHVLCPSGSLSDSKCWMSTLFEIIIQLELSLQSALSPYITYYFFYIYSKA